MQSEDILAGPHKLKGPFENENVVRFGTVCRSVYCTGLGNVTRQ